MDDQSWLPKPGPEHALLKQNVGVWDVECTYFMGPDQPPMTVKAKETVEMLGQFWTIGRFVSTMMGMPFAGVVQMGYDTARRKWVGSWIDTMAPFYFLFEGDYDASGKVLTMSGLGGDMMSGQMIRYRTTEETLASGQRRFEMFRDTPDGESKMFSYIYTLTKAARPAKKSAASAKKSKPASKPGKKPKAAKKPKSAKKPAKKKSGSAKKKK
ncbi:MAG: DUF1579 domain-containing protein [bacterium]